MNTIRNFNLRKMSPQLLVTDLERAVEFYTKQLGFEIDFRYEDFYAGISKDGYSIHLKLMESFNEKPVNKKSNEYLDILFSVDNIEMLHEAMQQGSIKIIQPLRSMPYGREFYVTDPDGNVIAFVTPSE